MFTVPNSIKSSPGPGLARTEIVLRFGLCIVVHILSGNTESIGSLSCMTAIRANRTPHQSTIVQILSRNIESINPSHTTPHLATIVQIISRNMENMKEDPAPVLANYSGPNQKQKNKEPITSRRTLTSIGNQS
jgi:hypothetical protein